MEFKSIQECESNLAFAKASGDILLEAAATLDLAKAHVASLVKKLDKCSVPSSEDSMEALRRSKDAFTLSSSAGSREGGEEAAHVASLVMTYNGVPPHAYEMSASDPEVLFQEVMAGKYTTPQNAFPAPPMPSKGIKLDEVVPSVKQLDHAKWGWYQPLKGYTYTLTWQATKGLKDRSLNNNTKRKAYDVLGINTGSKSFGVTALVGARGNDASERSEAFMVYMVSPDVFLKQGSQIMGMTNTIGAMVLSRIPKLTVVSLSESQADPDSTKVRQMHQYPITLGQIRSCRLECPTITAGYVGADFASWMSDPAPIVENIFDVVESDESERMYRNGDSYVPLLVERPLDDPIRVVRPNKPTSWIPAH